MEPIFVFLIAMATWVILSLGPNYLRSRERMKLLDLVKLAAERGETVPIEVINALPVEVTPQPNARRDLRRGTFLVSIAAALVAVGLCVYLALSGTEIGGVAAAIGIGIGAVGALPGCIGAALIFLGLSAKASAEV